MVASKRDDNEPALIPSGIEGLDDVLRGGLVPRRLYLVEGASGTGKTTMGLQFLLEGVRRGERCMFVTLSEAAEELRASIESHGWSAEGIDILELIASEDSLKADARYTMYHPADVELAETTKSVLAEADRIKPLRVVFDSLSELRLLAEDSLRYRRQILAIKRYFSRHQATVILIDDWPSESSDSQLHSLVHGVISLERLQGEYGSMRRRLQVGKLRDRAIREGYHDFVIRQDGIEIFPRLVAAEHRTSHAQQSISSGVERLDALLGGGLAKGTSTLIVGAAGTGKSSVATQFAMASARRGERAALYLFDEAVATFTERSAGLGMDIAPLVAADQMILRQVDPAELPPGEFACVVRNSVVKHNTQMVVIDSLNGFLNATPSERFLALHLHELLMFLGQQGVTTLLLMTQHGIIGGDVYVPVDASYLADTVILLRYFEAMGEVRQAISVIKKRTGNHERTIREVRLDHGITIGEPLRDFQGILTGSPTWTGATPTRKDGRRKTT